MEASLNELGPGRVHHGPDFTFMVSLYLEDINIGL